jgi:hypothetical protein
MIAGQYGLENLKYVVANFDNWIKEPHEDYAPVKDFYQEILSQWKRYIRHVNTHIGGIYETYKKQSQDGPSYIMVEKADQKKAFSFIAENVFEMPEWLIRRDLIAKFDASGVYERNLRQMQGDVLNGMLTMASLSRMLDASYNNPETYTVEELLSDIRHSLYKEIYKGDKMDVNKRSLQKIYLEKLKNLGPKNLSEEKKVMGVNILLLNDIQTIVWNELHSLQQDLASSLRKYKKGTVDRGHLELQLDNTKSIINSIKN